MLLPVSLARYSAAVVRLSATFVLLVAFAGPVAAQLIERPSWVVGDRWTYDIIEGPVWNIPGKFHSTETFVVIAADETEYKGEVTHISEDGAGATARWTTVWSRDLNLVFQDNPTLPSTERQFLRWPLKVGERWDFSQPVSNGQSLRWTVKVERWEDVSVPAGRFNAIVIEVERQIQGGGRNLQKRTVWYAPQIKGSVKQAWQIQEGQWVTKKETRELTSYELH